MREIFGAIRYIISVKGTSEILPAQNTRKSRYGGFGHIGWQYADCFGTDSAGNESVSSG